MKRFNDQKPADLCFARGTFNAHPYVMATMNAFLKFIRSEDGGKLYKQAAVIWPQRMEGFNQRMAELDLPVQMGGMESIWSVMYKVPSRYNWMLQFYLRDHGIALSWIGTGRLIFNFGMTDDEFDAFVNRFTTAVQQMKTDGWWWTQGEVTNKTIRQSLFREIVREKIKRAIKTVS
jgi:glutamate-1-semialdehyde 2,1-aminomutase